MAPPRADPAKSSRNIKDFFKPFAIPKDRRPANHVLEDEIVVATPAAGKPRCASQVSSDTLAACPASAVTARKTSKKPPAERTVVPNNMGSAQSRRAIPAAPPVHTHSSSAAKQHSSDGEPSPQRLTPDQPEGTLNINPLNGIAEVTPTEDSPIRLATASLSPVRLVTTVEVPISNQDDSAGDCHAPMAPPPVPSSSAVQAVNMSFSSISTLSSLPVSSQSSSKRVIKNGLHAVTNSDSGTDESSDNDLPDTSTFFANKRRKLSPPADIHNPAIRGNARLSDRNRESALVDSLPPVIKTANYKHSLAKLVKQSQKWTKSEAKIAELELTLEDAGEEGEDDAQGQPQEVDNEALVAATAGSDSDERERMMQALDRTEALKQEKNYRFFLDDTPQYNSSTFPRDALPDEPWSRIYRNEVSRLQACETGFAAELAAQFPLPMTITNWMATQLLHEPSEILCSAYVDILRASCDHPTSMSNTLSMLPCFYKTRSLADIGNGVRAAASSKLPHGLKYVMQVVRFCAPATDSIRPDESPEMTKNAFLDFALINIDESVMVDTALANSVTDYIEEMLDALSDEAYEKLVAEAVSDLSTSKDLRIETRCRMIAALPVGTVRSYRIRRRLALDVFTTVAARADSESQSWARSIMTCLKQRPEFSISDATDYSLLQHLVSVLNIAIDGGFTPYAQLAEALSLAIPTGPLGRLPPPTQAEAEHNKQIDGFTKALRFMANRIRDAGTSHLKRTEAKIAIEQLIVRLEHCVRTRPVPKKGVFGAEKQVAMSGFLKKQESTGDS